MVRTKDGIRRRIKKMAIKEKEKKCPKVLLRALLGGIQMGVARSYSSKA